MIRILRRIWIRSDQGETAVKQEKIALMDLLSATSEVQNRSDQDEHQWCQKISTRKVLRGPLFFHFLTKWQAGRRFLSKMDGER